MLYKRTGSGQLIPVIPYRGAIHEKKNTYNYVKTKFNWKKEIEKLAKDFRVKDKALNIIKETEQQNLPNALAYYNYAHRKLMSVI